MMGDPSALLTTRQMRAIEAAAIASGAVTAAALMQRAGDAVAANVMQIWPNLAQGGRAADRGRAAPDAVPPSDATQARAQVLILCGPGNNGGDGYIVACALRRAGCAVRVAQMGGPEGADAQAAFAQWGDDARAIESGHATDILANDPPALCIDALFGTGLTRPLAPDIAALLREIAASGCPIVAVDILSGVCADSGRVLGKHILPQAALTVTFHRRKLGHILDVGGMLGGQVICADIGLDGWQGAAGVCATCVAPVPALLKRVGHKYDYGHALIVAGPPGKGGAARLAARAALRAGAGLVTLGCAPDAVPENAARLGAIMLSEIADGAALQQALGDVRINAVCLGPGLGLARARALVSAALAAPRRAVVLDADALTAFADAPGDLFCQLHAGVLLTPHGGEFARLFPDLAGKLAADAPTGPAFSRLDAVRCAARRSGATVLLKGPDTVIATPDGGCVIAAAVGADAAPWLATAGSGDVLAGIITGLMARGFDALSAAGQGAWLHAEAARRFGPGLISEDLAEMLPQVFAALAPPFSSRQPPGPLL